MGRIASCLHNRREAEEATYQTRGTHRRLPTKREPHTGRCIQIKTIGATCRDVSHFPFLASRITKGCTSVKGMKVVAIHFEHPVVIFSKIGNSSDARAPGFFPTF